MKQKLLFSLLCFLLIAWNISASGGTGTLAYSPPNPITSSISFKKNISCNGANDGEATVRASGGFGILKYSWAPSGGIDSTATGLSAATYTCTITDGNNLTKIQTVTITEPTPIAASVTHTDAACYGSKTGSATVAPSGGTSPYIYWWAPTNDTTTSIKNIALGSYTVTVIDANGCGITKTVIVSEPSKLLISGTASLIKCYGDQSTIKITATGATPPYLGTGIFLKYAGN